MKYYSKTVILFITLFVTGCQSSKRVLVDNAKNNTVKDSSIVKLSIPFMYQGVGIGPDNDYIRIIPSGAEKTMISKSALAALQGYGFNVLNLAPTNYTFEPGSEYKTGILELSQAKIDQYNSFNETKLPSIFYYGIAVKFLYIIDDKNQEVRFVLKPIVYKKRFTFKMVRV